MLSNGMKAAERVIRDDAQPSGEAARASAVPDKLPLAGADTDWREFRARLVASQVLNAASGSHVRGLLIFLMPVTLADVTEDTKDSTTSIGVGTPALRECLIGCNRVSASAVQWACMRCVMRLTVWQGSNACRPGSN